MIATRVARYACLLLLWSISTSAMQCDCVDVGLKRFKRIADVVFQGTIVGFDGPNGTDFAVFDVERVWKGDVARKFVIASVDAPCHAIIMTRWAIGSELLVFASRGTKVKLGTSEQYFPLSCATRRIADSGDLGALGRWRKPK